MDALTLLSPQGQVACKRVGPNGVQSAPPCTWHLSRQWPVNSFPELAEALTTLGPAHAWFVVRGAVIAENPEHMRRTHADANPSLVETPRRWLFMDLDSVLPEITDFAERPAHYAAVVRGMLPAAFADTACFWQATGSAGIKPGVRLRLVFWLSRPLGCADIKQWSRTWGVPVDLSIYTPSQPHYTAYPLFEGGVSDPVRERCGVLPGPVDTVLVPLTFTPSEAYEDLQKTARGIERQPEGRRRNALNAAAYRLSKRYSEDELPGEAIFEVLDRAAGSSGLPGAEAVLTLRYAIRDGRSQHATEHAGWRDKLARDKDDNPKSTLANTSLVLSEHPYWAGRFARHSRDMSIVWVRSPEWGHKARGTPVGTEDLVRAVEWFQSAEGMDVRESWLKSALYRASEGHTYDPVIEYLESCPPWDGQARADSVFIRHLGVKDTPLVRASTLLWLGQAVRRAYATAEEPVKADYVILLTGPQGVGKSGVLERLCPPGQFRDHIPKVGNKDAQVALSAAWIIELAEFTQRAADTDAFKAFVSTTVDKYRPPYAAVEVSIPRRCVLAITTNQTDPLVDRTGNRRFLPMECTHHADFAAVLAERDQVWAEVQHWVLAGLPATLPRELWEHAAAAQADRLEELPLTSLFRSTRAVFAPGCEWEPGQVVDGCVLYLRTVQACAIAGVRQSDTREVGRVKSALSEAGWTEIRGKNRDRRWLPPDDIKPIDKTVN